MIYYHSLCSLAPKFPAPGYEASQTISHGSVTHQVTQLSEKVYQRLLQLQLREVLEGKRTAVSSDLNTMVIAQLGRLWDLVIMTLPSDCMYPSLFFIGTQERASTVNFQTTMLIYDVESTYKQCTDCQLLRQCFQMGFVRNGLPCGVLERNDALRTIWTFIFIFIVQLFNCCNHPIL